MNGPLFSEEDDLLDEFDDLLDEFDDLEDLEDKLDRLLDSPTDFDEYVMNEDDCAD